MNKSKPEQPKTTLLRNVSLAVVVFLVVLVGLPWFHFTTTIHRATLPVDDINFWNENLNHKIKFEVPVYLHLSNAKADFIDRAQAFIDTHLYEKYPSLREVWALQLKRTTNAEEIEQNKGYLVELEIVSDKDDGTEASDAVAISPISRNVKLVLSNTVLLTDKVDEFLHKILVENVFDSEIKKFNQLVTRRKRDTNLVFPYSSHFNLIFSLLVEDGQLVDWKIDKALEKLQPAIEDLKHFANFTISTHIQYYSQLSSQPEEQEKAFVIRQSDLSTFINFGDWNFNNNDLNPTINFVTFFPASNSANKPLVIEGSRTNSFLIPQWGGVVIHNKQFPKGNTNVKFEEQELVSILQTFTSQLLQLLGSSQTPKSLPIRLDTMTRWSIYNNVLESLDNLNSLVKLTNTLNEIAIPDETKQFIDESLTFLNSSVAQVNNQELGLAMISSARCLEKSNKAFFDKEIVQQVYFPSEHKMAVFLPLAGPILTMVFFSVVRLVKTWKST